MIFRQYDPIVLERVHKVEKEILIKFISICEQYNLKYFVAFGTLLGAVRHNGFIPWDDDVDVAMPRKDYEVFLEVAQKECGSEYFLQTVDTDENYHLFFAKLRMNDTIFVENSLQQSEGITGFYIDIFPYDTLPDDDKLMKKQIKEAEILGMLISIKRVKEPQIGQYHKAKELLLKIIWKLLHYGMKLCHLKDETLQKKCECVFKRYDNREPTRMTCFFPEAEKWIVKNDEIKELLTMPFEDICVSVPKGYDEILKRSYGEYMELPPKEKRVNHMPVRMKFRGEDEIIF